MSNDVKFALLLAVVLTGVIGLVYYHRGHSEKAQANAPANFNSPAKKSLNRQVLPQPKDRTKPNSSRPT